ncbi:MAG: bifunctional UDP-N-acetylglucosamine diphosphorylase/glucosamine-1-phosphate N-acetyltransferase GlmU [Nitrospirae bacterium]|nr:bifunctional UDP-N-acetylglucosamine diphosphorylase/glucosamine-1-phosphate N-acetyltransferase GlmU [Nitrospirota bacterium]
MRTACIILAAGQGKRMRSALPKVLHRVCGMPMLQAVIDTAAKLKPERVIVVAGRQIDILRKEITVSDVQFMLQKEPKGTGDALKSAMPALKNFRGTVVVLNGDTPLIEPQTIKRLLALHQKNHNAVSVLSFHAEDPKGYGRIIRDRTEKFLAIVEEKDADNSQKKIHEVNSGVYAIDHDAFSLLDRLVMNRQKGEYYLTDIVSLSLMQGLRTSAFAIGGETEFMGVNTREELLRAAEVMRQGVVRNCIARGVNFLDPASAFIHPHTSIGRDTTIYPNVFIEAGTKIGSNVTIYPHVRVLRSTIDDHAVIRDSTVIEDSHVSTGASVGPFAHIRPGSEIGAHAKIGNFVELKKAVIGNRAKASHLSYLGDAVVGREVNIGAGTITCNYDGEKKHQTIIGDHVFVGSDTQFVAPVKIGKGAYIGAGSTITKDVPPGSLAVSRTEQRNIKDWVKNKQAKAKGKAKK